MKRDMDLIRALLLFAEEHVDGASYQRCDILNFRDEFPQLDKKTLYGHVKLLREAGFFGQGADSLSSIDLDGLTWAGYEFLDSIRDLGIWNQTKEAASHAGGFTVEILGDLAKGFLKTKIQKHTGVEI